MRVKRWICAAAFLGAAALAGCGGESGREKGKEQEVKRPAAKTVLTEAAAEDGTVDFEALQKENPDIFAWLHVPGTDIDVPIVQSPVSDEFYKTHREDKTEGEGGAAYTEMPNLMNMCDFNTIVHGSDEEDSGPFGQLHRFEDPDFFEEHDRFYIYLPDNVLTYTVFAAYYDEDDDILRRFDYTTYEGCADYIKQLYGLRDMGKKERDGFEELTPYHFLVTLNGDARDGRQYVVLGVLTADAAGRIDRVILNN